MRYIKYLIFFIFILLIPSLIVESNPYYGLLLFIPIGLCFINFGFRKYQNMQAYFTSPWNVMCSNEYEEIVSDLNKDLFFHKIIEVIKSKDIEVFYSNIEEYKICASTSMSLQSWGENIYIQLIDDNENSIAKMYSVSIIGLVDWNKNSSNQKELIEEFEKSLTI